MLKSNIVADVTSEILRKNPSLIKDIPKKSQEVWQVDIVIREDINLLSEVNLNLISQYLADFVIESMVKKPSDYLDAINYLPRKYHNKDMVKVLVKSIQIFLIEGFSEDLDLEEYLGYFTSIRQDLITRNVIKFLLDNELNLLIRKLDPAIVKRFTKFRPIKKDIKRSHLPKNLDKIQVIILRYMRNNDLDVITVPQLKKANLVTSDTEKMIQFYKGKPLTIKDIISYKMADTKETGTLFNYIQKNNKPVYVGTYNLHLQKIFLKKANHLFGVVITNADKVFKRYPELYDPDAGLHFESPVKNTILLGWVRYTKIGKDIWIDEIQSDITKNYYYKELLQSDTLKIYDLLLNEFIRNIHRRSSGKLLLPTYEVKTKLYKDFGTILPPKYIYDKLPKKFRFKKDTVTNIDDKVDGLDSWILAHVKK